MEPGKMDIETVNSCREPGETVSASNNANYEPMANESEQLQKELTSLVEKIATFQSQPMEVVEEITNLSVLAHDIDEINATLKMLIRNLKVNHPYGGN
jgi:hypothetical protein